MHEMRPVFSIEMMYTSVSQIDGRPTGIFKIFNEKQSQMNAIRIGWIDWKTLTFYPNRVAIKIGVNAVNLIVIHVIDWKFN